MTGFLNLSNALLLQTVNLPGEGGGVNPARGQRERGEGWEPKGAVTRASLIDRQVRGGAFSTHKEIPMSLLLFNVNLDNQYFHANVYFS